MNTHTPWHKLTVEPVDTLRFRIQSESGAAAHFVDMAECDGAGKCDCKDWECRVGPVISGKKSPPPNQPAWTDHCKHTLRAKLFLADMLIKRILEGNE